VAGRDRRAPATSRGEHTGHAAAASHARACAEQQACGVKARRHTSYHTRAPARAPRSAGTEGRRQARAAARARGEGGPPDPSVREGEVETSFSNATREDATTSVSSPGSDRAIQYAVLSRSITDLSGTPDHRFHLSRMMRELMTG